MITKYEQNTFNKIGGFIAHFPGYHYSVNIRRKNKKEISGINS